MKIVAEIDLDSDSLKNLNSRVLESQRIATTIQGYILGALSHQTGKYPHGTIVDTRGRVVATVRTES